MKLREYVPDSDFDAVRSWINGRREHALWCADRVGYPLTREGFDRLLEDEAARFGNKAFIALSGEGDAVGFLCVSVNNNEAMLKFVLVDPYRRGQGIGREMLTLAVGQAFDDMGAGIVRLCVFSANTAARRCYERAGFTVSGTEAGAFSFDGEQWDRCRMFIEKEKVKNWQR
ncbi:MAG: GNAT family N-acetyltransferase [Ruminiclostridium sp.]|nr:GNAT family N-acetyltransferase [Ruminiclostridium sp.]